MRVILLSTSRWGNINMSLLNCPHCPQGWMSYLLWVHGLLFGGANVEAHLGTLIEQGDELAVERVDLQTKCVEIERHLKSNRAK